MSERIWTIEDYDPDRDDFLGAHSEQEEAS